MSNQFLKLRRSAVPGKIPDTGSLDLGEIALNTYDGRAFMKKSGSAGEQIVIIGNPTGSFTGSFSGEFTGSLLGTASWAYNAVTASTADDFYIRGNVTGSNALFSGTVTAQRLVVQTISSSVIYSSGSNIFGDELTDTQQFTGSVTITGSLSLNGDPVVTQTPYNIFSSSIQLRATNLESTASILTSASASFAQDSGSNSIRITNLESTASILTIASASYASASGSLSTRVTTLENASASFAQDSGSNSVRLTNLESTASILTQASASFSSSIALLSGSFTSFSSSYLIDSASWNNNISLLSQSFLQTSQSLSASIQLLSGSFLAFSQSYNTGSFTGSFFGQAVLTGSFTGDFYGDLSGSFSGSVANIHGTTDFIAKFDTPNSVDSSVIYQSASHIAINETSFTANDPEALYVFQTHPTSFNVITGKGNTNNYLQLNIQNTNQGISASSDIVATANNGNEFSNYIDMGINSENFNTGFIGEANDAYVYSIANNLHIGNAATNGSHLGFFVGGDDVEANMKLQLNPNNRHIMSGSLELTGSLSVLEGITGSLYGTSSWAVSASHAPTALTSSYAVSASYSLTATSASHAINSDIAISASYAATASSADNFLVRQNVTASNALITGTLTAQTIIAQYITSSTEFITGSTKFGTQLTDTHQFTGSVTITGSLSLNNDPVVTQTPYNTFSQSIQLRATNLESTASILTSASASFAQQSGSNSIRLTNLESTASVLTTASASFAVVSSSYASASGSLSTRVTNLESTASVLTTASASFAIVSSSYSAASQSLSTRTTNLESTASILTTASASFAIVSSSYASASGSLSIRTTNLETTASVLTTASASFALVSQSYASASGSLSTRITNLESTASVLTTASASFALVSSSYAAFSASYNTGSFTGSFTGRGNLTGSLFGTASWALNAVTASHATTALSASYAISASNAQTASFAQSGNGTFSGSFSGSFFGNGAGLTNISASSVVGLNLSLISSGSVTASTDPAYGFRVNSNTQISGSTQITGSLGVTGSVSISGSIGSVFSANVDTLVFSGSLLQTGSIALTGSLSVFGGITGSLFGTASWAQNAVTASHAVTALSSSYALSGSYSLTATSASHALNANNAISASYAATASSADNFLVRQNVTASNALITGTLTAQTIIAQYITSSTEFITGSTKFGSQLTDTHQFTGSVTITGSLSLNNSAVITDSTFTPFSSSVSTRVTNLESTASVLTTASASFAIVSSSYASASGSLSTRVTNLESTASVLTTASASFAIVSSSFATTSASLSTRTTNLESTASVLTTASASFALVSSSYSAFSQSYNSGSFTGSFTGRLIGTASWASNAVTSSYVLQAVSASFATSASYAVSSSYAYNTDFLDGKDSSVFATTGSNIFVGNQTVTGSLFTSGSNTLVGSTTLTGSLNVTGSTIQTGNNTLIGNTTLSGSIIISGSTGPGATVASVQIYGDIRQAGYHRFDPVTTNIDNSISASYIYVSGSTNDLYFTQNGAGYGNTTRLRWIEGNLYTGLLNGGLITTQSSTVYQVSSGSGIIVDLNANLNDNPYPTVQYLNWPNLTGSISAFTSSYQQLFVGIDNTNNLYAQGTPFTNGQFDTLIAVGDVFFQNGSTINGVKTAPSLAYGWKQRSNVFISAFGPLKLSGFTLAPSGSSTGSLIVGSGTAFADGQNYTVDPDNPSYIIDSGTNVSKIFRYYQSGSAWVYQTNAGAGFGAIDPANYSNNGTLTSVGAGNWSIQRVFWFPNSVTKAIVVYYGNNIYATEAEAIANLSIESFVEAPNTAANAVYVGSIVISGNGVFTNASTFTILPGGLFRQVGGSGGGGSVVTQTLSGLSDVNISGPTNGQPLVYNSTSGKWENSSTLIANLTGNASTATSASFATTASYVLQAVSASYALSASSAVQANTASYVLQAVSASFATTASFASQASTASYVLQAISASFASQAATASYVLNAVSASYAATASSADNFLVRQNVTASNALITGTLTAQTIIAQYITSSTEFITGSTKFGTLLTDTHQFTGSVTVTGSLSVDNSPVVTNATFTPFSSSVSTRVTNLESTASILTTASASFAIVSASYASASGSLSTRVTTLENASASFAQQSGSNSIRLTNLESTASVLTTASASFAIVSASYSSASSSLSGRVTRLESTASVLTTASASFAIVSSSFASTSASLSTRTTNLESTASVLTTASASFAIVSSSFATTSASLSTRTTNLESTASVLTTASASFAIVSSSYASASGSLSTRVTRLESTASVLTTASASFAIVSSSFATTSASLSTRTTNLESTASVLTTASASFAIVSSSFATTSGSLSTRTTNLETTASVLTTASASFAIVSASYAALSGSFRSGSYTGSFTGTLFGTASWASNSVTSSYVLNAVSASFASTASSVNTLNQNVIITGSLTVGQTTLGSGENTLVLGLPPNGGTGEGGQLLLAASGGTYTSASMLDNYQNKFRILRGTNASSDAFKFQVDMHTGQIQIPNYNSATAFLGVSASFLAVDTNGVLLTSNLIPSASFATSASFASTASYVLQAVSASFATTASFAQTASFVPTSSLVGNFFVQGGNSFGTQALLGTNDAQNLAFETSGSTRMFISSSGNVGIGTTAPSYLLHVQSTTGTVFSIDSRQTTTGAINTGPTMLFGGHDGVNARDFATIAGLKENGTSGNYAAYLAFSTRPNGGSLTERMRIASDGNVGINTTTPSAKLDVNGNAVVSGSLTVAPSSNIELQVASTGVKIGNISTDAHTVTGSFNISGSSTITGPLTATNITGSLFGTASWAVNAITASFVLNAVSASYAATASSADNFLIRQNATASNLLVNNTITAQTLIVQTVTSSIVYSSGSNIFGNQLTDVQQFTGSLRVTGSGNHFIMGGNVGLDISSPTAKLDLAAGSGTSQVGLRIRSLSTNSNGFNIVTNSSTDDIYLNNFYNAAMLFGTNNTERMRIAGGGNVGINDTNPQYKLSVAGDANITANLTATGSIRFPSLSNSNQVNVVSYNTSTGQLFYQTTSSLSVTSASYAATSSHAVDFTIQNTLNFAGTLTDYATVISSVAGSNNLFTQTTGSYTSGFFKYTVSNGANARTGEMLAVWNGASVQYTDNSTLDIGSTTPVTCSVSLVGSDVLFNVQTNTSGWRIKSIGTFM